MKVALLIPAYNQQRKLLKLFKYLYKLNPAPTVTVFAENNSRDNTLKRIRRFIMPKKLIRVWFRDNASSLTVNPYVPIAHIRQLLLTKARRLNVDYAVFLDSDVLPEPNLIAKLTHHSLDIVGGPYLRRWPYGVYLASVWRDRGKLRLYEHPPSPLSEVELTSAGCFCLNKRIIQDRNVYFYPMWSNTASEDFGYCRRARKAGYHIYVDGTVQLRHEQNTRIKPWTQINGEYADFSY